MTGTDVNQGTSTRPYLLRALHDWCTDNGFTPYIAVYVDGTRAGADGVREEQRDRAQRRLRGHLGPEAGQRVHRVQGALRRQSRATSRCRSTMSWRSTRARTARAWPSRCPPTAAAAPPRRRLPRPKPASRRHRCAACAWRRRSPRPTQSAADDGPADEPPDPASAGRPAVAQARQVASRRLLESAPYPRRLSSVGRAPAL